MSLINRMLTDLEERNGHIADQTPEPATTVLADLGAAQAFYVSRSWPRILVWSGLALLVLTSAYAGTAGMRTGAENDPSNTMADPVQLAHLTPAPGSVTRPSAPPPVPPKPKHQQEPDRAFEAAPFRLRITHRLSNVDKADWVVDESDEPPAVLAAIDASLADDPPAAAAPPETPLHQPERPTDQPGADPSALTSADTVRVSETMAIDEVERQFDDGIAAIAAGDGAEGERLLSEVLVADPDHVPARETLAAYLAREGRLARAAALLVEGRQRQPQERRLAKLYARILVEQGQVQESLSVLAEAAPAIQVDPEYHALRAALLQRVDQHLDAAAVFSQVVRLRPGEARWWVGLGISLEALGETAQASQAYQQAASAGHLEPPVQQFLRGKVAALGLASR